MTCREDCPFYKYTKQYTCYKDNYCAKQPRCNGNVVGCEFVDSDMWVCQAVSIKVYNIMHKCHDKQ